MLVGSKLDGRGTVEEFAPASADSLTHIIKKQSPDATYTLSSEIGEQGGGGGESTSHRKRNDAFHWADCHQLLFKRQHLGHFG